VTPGGAARSGRGGRAAADAPVCRDAVGARTARALLLSVVALVAALLAGCAGSADDPAASESTPQTQGEARTGRPAPAQTAQSASTLQVDAVSPAVVRPDQTATITGLVRAPAGGGIEGPAVRAVKSRQFLATRSDVDAWADATGPANGTEIARIALPASVAAGESSPFTLVLPAAALRLTRSYGAVPIAIEVLDGRGSVRATVRTFVGWHRAIDYVPISLAWVVPLTLDPEPALSSALPAARTAAWQAAVGAGSRLERLVQATSASKAGWAVDPAILGRDKRTPEQVAADPVTPVIAPFLDQVRQGAARRTVVALPYADLDLAAASQGALVQDLVARGAELGTTLGAPVRTGVVWPADGALPPGREAAFKAAYPQGLTAILTSTELTETARSLTPVAPAVGTGKTPVVRWDDRLSDLAAQTGSGAGALVTQEYVAQVAALLGERPGVARTFLVTGPRGLDADPGVLSGLLATSESLPWVTTIDLSQAVAEAVQAGRPTVDELDPPAGEAPAVLTPALLDTLEREKALIATMSHTLVDSAGFSVQWQDTVDQLTSVRWRKNPSGHERLLDQVVAATSSVSQGMSIVEQTTNFYADEGILQVTIVNDLPDAVEGVQLNLAPGNARLRVVEPADPVRIEARSKATVQVRMAAVAGGLVPVNAWLTTIDGVSIGQKATLTVRAAPPGAWMYVAAGSVAGLILVVGIVRGFRRPKATPPELQELDLVTAVAERPLEDPVRTRPRNTEPPPGAD
jgi:hypothetical protein